MIAAKEMDLGPYLEGPQENLHTTVSADNSPPDGVYQLEIGIPLAPGEIVNISATLAHRLQTLSSFSKLPFHKSGWKPRQIISRTSGKKF